jgi:hypothetical protein
MDLNKYYEDEYTARSNNSGEIVLRFNGDGMGTTKDRSFLDIIGESYSESMQLRAEGSAAMTKAMIDNAPNIGKGVVRGLGDFVEGTTSLFLSPLNDATGGSIDWLDTWINDNQLQAKLEGIFPESELGMSGNIARGFGQYTPAVIGGYGIAGLFIKGIGRVILAEPIIAATAPRKGDPNLATLIRDMSGINDENADTIYREVINWVGSTEEDGVLMTKLKAIIGDAPAGIAIEPIFHIGKIMRALKNNPELKQEAVKISKYVVLEDTENPGTFVVADNETGEIITDGSQEKMKGLADEFNQEEALIDEDAVPASLGAAANTNNLTSVQLMNSQEPIITGTGKNNKVKVDDIINYFENQPKLDITNEQDFSTMVDIGVKEINYQLKQDITGVGWYDKDVAEAMEIAARANPKIANNANIKDLIPFLTAIASPGTPVGADWTVAVKLANIYADTGKLPNMNPETGAGWTRRPAIKTQLLFTQAYIDKFGLEQFLDFLSTSTTVKEVNATRKDLGFKPIAGAMGKQIYGADMFGPKVGPFMANLMGTSDNNVPDIWFTRGFNRKAGNMFIVTKEGDKSVAGQPRNLKEREIMNNYIDQIASQVGLNRRDTQAVLWYFEQGLYTKLGVKSEPKSYADATRKIFGETNVEDGGIPQSKESNTSSTQPGEGQ